MKKNIYFVIIIVFFTFACGSVSVKNKSKSEENPVVIKNDSLEYEIIIIDPGFNLYLNTVAKPEGYYSQNYLENKNQFYVTTWNYRVANPTVYNPNIYENNINYNPNVNYGYDVNYKLYNYFEFAQRKYKMILR